MTRRVVGIASLAVSRGDHTIFAVRREDGHELQIILERLLFHCLEERLLFVGVGEALNFGVIHIGECAGGVGGAPGSVLHGRFVEQEIFSVEDARLRLGRASRI